MCFAFQYAANWLWDIYNNVTGELESGHLDNLPEVSVEEKFSHVLFPLIFSFMQRLVF